MDGVDFVWMVLVGGVGWLVSVLSRLVDGMKNSELVIVWL